MLRHIDAEFQIQRAQVIRQFVPDPVAFGNRVARITQDVNLQLLFGFYCLVIFPGLGGDSDKRATQTINFPGGFCESIQLQITIRSPLAAVKR